MSLKWYPAVAAAVFALFLALFLIARAWNVPVLADPTPQLRQAGVPAAFLGVGLLLVDALLPVPSSLVMIAHGAAFGVRRTPVVVRLPLAGRHGRRACQGGAQGSRH